VFHCWSAVEAGQAKFESLSQHCFLAEFVACMNVHPWQVESFAQSSWQLDASPVKEAPGELGILLPPLSLPGSGAAHVELGGLGVGVEPGQYPSQKPEVYVFHCWSAVEAGQAKFESLSQHCFLAEFVACMNVHPLQVESLAQSSWQLDASPVKEAPGELGILLPPLSLPGSGAAHVELAARGASSENTTSGETRAIDRRMSADRMQLMSAPSRSQIG